MKKRGIKTKSYSISSKGYLERFTARHKSNTMCTEQKVPAVVIPSLILDDAQQAEWSPKSPQAARNLRQVLIHLLGC